MLSSEHHHLSDFPILVEAGLGCLCKLNMVRFVSCQVLSLFAYLIVSFEFLFI